ncbi:MAG: hypothetical protein NUK65_09350 [Firmicutes bacterium]|nr:hypothetical protein [Bacillota bacterium]
MADYQGIIGVVGNCVAGKTTLVNGLTALGYRAANSAQEHSMAPKLWMRKNPTVLVYLYCSLATAQKRRQIFWGQERLNDQWQRLAHARAHCDLFLTTDEMTIQDVLETVITFVSVKHKLTTHE